MVRAATVRATVRKLHGLLVHGSRPALSAAMLSA